MGRKKRSVQKSLLTFLLSCLLVLPLALPPAPAHAASTGNLPARQAEYLDHGLVAVLTDGGVFVSWRYLNTDSDEIAYNVYKNGMKVNPAPIIDSTNYVDTTGADSSQYQISTIVAGKEEMQPERAAVWHNSYLPIPLDKPEGGRTKDGGRIPITPEMPLLGIWTGTGNTRSFSCGVPAIRRIIHKLAIQGTSTSMRSKWTAPSSGALTLA